MNFGNPPFIPKDTKLICVNGSSEELEYNFAADEILLSHPAAFLDAMTSINRKWENWFELQTERRKNGLKTGKITY